jgi:small subunit ribosomal protein S4
MKLFLKGDRCYSTKCAIEKRNYPPGQHGQRRSKPTEYGLQLREKQKMKRLYGLLENQFRNYFRRAATQKGVTAENLVRLLELRLDSVVHRVGFAASRAQARQLIRHRHFAVNGRRADIPSYSLRVGDVIEVRAGSRELVVLQAAMESVRKRPAPGWLEVDPAAWRAVVRSQPTREDLPVPVHEELIVALYSK